MFIPRFWFRVADGSRTSLGWSDASAFEAEKLARSRWAKLAELGDDATPSDWDYYPSTPVKEEILETPRPLASGSGAALITRNRAGVEVLNTDRVAFVDIDLRSNRASLLSSIGGLFGRKSAKSDEGESAALARVAAWADASSVRLRAYRTAGGLRLIRMDRLIEPDGDECAAMFEALGADPLYGRLCRVQKSFRARLTPKPHRIGCSAAPGSHPRTDPEMVQAFANWLADYEQARAGLAVAAFIAEYGSAQSESIPQVIAALHDRRTLLNGGKLA